MLLLLEISRNSRNLRGKFTAGFDRILRNTQGEDRQFVSYKKECLVVLKYNVIVEKEGGENHQLNGGAAASILGLRF